MAYTNHLKLTTFNCEGFKYRNYDYISETFNKCDILLLQETWLYNFEHNILNNILQSSQYHAISAMDEADIGRAGRPYGGCEIVWHPNLNLSIEPVSITSVQLSGTQSKLIY